MDVRAARGARIHRDAQVLGVAVNIQFTRTERPPIVPIIIAVGGIEHHHRVELGRNVEVPFGEGFVVDGECTGHGRSPHLIMQGDPIHPERVRPDGHRVAEGVLGVEIVDPETGILQHGLPVHLRVGKLARDGHLA